MLLYPEWLIVARCPSCLGQFVYRSISAFEIRSQTVKEGICHEGAEVFKCRLSGKNHLLVDINGPCCEETHSFIYSLKELSSPAAIEMVCQPSGVNLGYIGTVEAVTGCVSEDFGELIDYCGSAFNIFWRRPDLVKKIFFRINELYAEHNVSCGHCSSHNIDVETVNGDSIVLVCRSCGIHGGLYADRDVNWQIVKNAAALRIDTGCIKIKRAEKRAVKA